MFEKSGNYDIIRIAWEDSKEVIFVLYKLGYGDSMNGERKRKILGLIFGIIFYVFLISSLTFAYYSWTSDHTSVNLKLHDGGIKFVYDDNNRLTGNNLSGVLDYTNSNYYTEENNGRYLLFSEYTATNTKETAYKMYAKLNIKTLSNSLKSNAVKWVLQYKTTANGSYSVLKDVNNNDIAGNFASMHTGSNDLYDNIYVKPGETIYYRFVVYIDGNVNNNISGSIDADLELCDLEVPVFIVKLNNSNKIGPSTINYSNNNVYESYGVGIYRAFNSNSYTLSEKMGTSSNPITVPTACGYTFSNYNDSGTALISSGGYITNNFTSTHFKNDATLTDSWNENTYKITTNNNGGSVTLSKSNNVKYTSDVVTVTAVKNYKVNITNSATATLSSNSVSGYQTFDGWTASNLNSCSGDSSAKYGNSNTPSTTWSNGSSMVKGNTNSSSVTTTYFKQLNSESGGTVNLTANWTPVAITLPTANSNGYTCGYTTSNGGTSIEYPSGGSYTPSATNGTATLYTVKLANKGIINIKKDGALCTDCGGYKISLSTSNTTDNGAFSGTTTTSSSITVAGDGEGPGLSAGTTYYIWIGSDSNHKTSTVYSGVTITGVNGTTEAGVATATINYYTLTMNMSNATVTFNGTSGITNGTDIITAGTSSATHSLAAVASNGYSFSSWASSSASTTITNTAAATTTLKAGAKATITLSTFVNNYQNTTTGTYYEHLKDALNGVQSNQTIKVINGITETTASTLTAGKVGVTLDLDGNTTTLSGVVLNNNGSLTVTSTTAGGVLSGTGASVINNDTGTLTVSGIVVTGTKNGINTTTGPVTVTSGTVKTSGTANSNYGIYKNGASGTITVTGGSVTGYYGIYNNAAGPISITGGSVTGITAGIYNKTSGVINVTGGTISSNAGIVNAATGAITINGANVKIEGTSGNGITGATGTISVINGTITGTAHGISSLGTGTVSVNGGYIATTGTATTSDAINKGGTGSVTVSGGILTGNRSGIYNNGTSPVLVSGGQITGATQAIYNGSTGVVTITNGTLTGNAGVVNKTTGVINVDGSNAKIEGINGNGITGASGTVSVINGTVTGTNHGIASVGVGTVSVSGGYIATNGTATTSDGIDKTGTGTVTVSGGTVIGYRAGIYNGGTTIVTVSGGQITGTTQAIYNNSTGVINVTGGTVTGNSGIVNKNNAVGVINVSGTNTKVEGINGVGINGVIGNVSVSSGSVIGSTNGAVMTTGSISITGGTVTGTTYGVSITGTGTLTMGEDSGTPSITIPLIQATGTSGARGVYISNTNGKYNFYDGKVTSASGTGTSIGFNGSITTPDGYGVIRTTASGIETAVLGRQFKVTLKAGTGATNLTLSGWTGSPGTTLTKDVVVNDVLLLSSITVTNDTGYHGSTWTKTSGSGTVSGGTFTMGASAATLTISGIANTYTVKFASNTSACTLNATTYADINATYNENISNSAIANPTCSGYTFTGWTLSGDKNTSTAKYGTTSSPATAWADGNKGTFFKNLSTTNNGTVTLTAGWMANNYQNMSTNVYYDSLKNALSEVQSNQTIKVIKGVTETTAATLTAGKVGVTLDLNSNTTTLSGVILYNSGSLNITDNGTGGVLSGTGAAVIDNGTGTLTVSGGMVTGTKNGVNTTTGPVTVTGGTVKTTGTTNSNYGIYKNGSSGTVTISGGSVTGYYGIYNNVDGPISITGGTVGGITAGIYNKTSGVINVTGGTVTSKAGIVNAATGAITINGANAKVTGTSGNGITGATGTISVINGTVTGSIHGISSAGTGSISITGGYVASTATTGNNDGINKAGDGSISISNGTVIGFRDGIYYGGVGQVNVTGGTITGNNGIVNNSSGEIIINGANVKVDGINGNGITGATGIVTVTSGTVTGKAQGISSTGTGTVSINGGYVASTATTGNNDGINKTGDGSVSVSNGTVIGFRDGIYYSGVGLVNVTGGTITGNNGIVNDKSGSVTVNGANAKVSGTNGNGINGSTTTITITKGTVTGSSTGISSSNGVVIVNGGYVASTGANDGIYANGSNGSVTVSSGTVTGNRAGIYNNGTTPVNVNGGKVTGTTQAVYNNSTGVITVSGGTLTGNNGIVNKANGVINVSGNNTKVEGTNGVGINGLTGNVTISSGSVVGSTSGATMTTGTISVAGGTVTGTTYGVSMSGAGRFTMGENSGTPSTTIPLIQATGTSGANGVYLSNTGATYNFYDGKVTSASGTGTSINANLIINTPVGYDVVKTTASNTETAVLGAANNYQNMTTNVKYMYLYKALLELESNQTIKVLTGITETTAATISSSISGATINLNGNTTTLSGVNIVNNGELTITGTSGEITGNVTNLINSKTGTLTISGGTVTSTMTAVYSETGPITVSGGAVVSTATTGNYDGIYKNGSSGLITISGGNIVGYRAGVYNNGASSIVKTGGTVTGIQYGIYNGSTGNVDISGGQITGTTQGLYNNSTGAVNVIGGNITGNSGIVNKVACSITINGNNAKVEGTSGNGITGATATVTVTKGTVTGSASGITSTGAGTVLVNGGYVASTATSGNNDGINKSGSGSITVSSGTVVGYRTGIYNGGTSPVNVSGGNVTGTTQAIYNNSTGVITVSGGNVTGSNGIVNKENGVINVSGTNTKVEGTNGIGINGLTASVTVSSGSVVGSTSGVSITTGTLNASGGIITGAQYGINVTTGVVNVNNCYVSSTGTSSTFAGIYKNGASGLLKVSSGTVTGRYGIYNNVAGPIRIEGGLVNGDTENGIYNKTTGAITIIGGTVSGVGHGIHMEGAGTLTMGENSGTPSTTIPLIKTTGTSGKYGVYVKNASTAYNFYDGKVTSTSGSGYSIYYTSTFTTPNGYYVTRTTTSGTETAILGAKYTVKFASANANCAVNISDIITAYPSDLVNMSAIANPSCSGYLFTGWTASGDIDTSVAKYGTSNNPTTAWVNGNKGTYFKNLSTTTNGTVTLTAGWDAIYWSIGTNYYTTLANAVNAANAGDTIKAYAASFTDSSAVTIGKNLTIDTNGKHVTRTATTTINSGATVAIAGSGTLTTSSAITLITNTGGVLNITHTGLISNTNTGNYRTVTNTNSAVTNKTGTGTITSTVAYDTLGGTGVFNITKGLVSKTVAGNAVYSNGGTITISGGTVSTEATRAVYVIGEGTTTISGGLLQKTGTMSGALVQNSGTGTMTISGGTVSSNSASNAIYNGSTGVINVTGGLVQNIGSGPAGDNHSTGVINVSNKGVVQSSSSMSLYNTSTGTINVTGGTVTGLRGIVNNVNGEVNVSGAATKVEGTNGIGITGATGKVTINSGNVIGSTDALTATTGQIIVKGGTVTGSANGVSISGTGSLTMGENGGTPSTTIPLIQATATSSSYGVNISNNGATYNFYDGIVKGYTGKSITYGGTINTPTGYSVVKSTSGSVESATLSNSYSITVIAGYGMDKVDATGWTNTGTSTMTKSVAYGSTITLCANTASATAVKGTPITGYTGCSGVSSGGGSLDGNKFTVGVGGATITLSVTGIATPTCTTSGAATKVYNYQDTTITGINSTSYNSPITVYYSFGYSTATNGTLDSFTTASTASTTNITKNAYLGTRYYGVKTYATDGTLTSSTCTQTKNYQKMELKRVKIAFNANSGSVSGTTPLYVQYGSGTLYTTATGTATASIPTASKTGNAWHGWYNDTSGGTLVINNTPAIVASVDGWTNASKQWVPTTTEDRTLYAHYDTQDYVITLVAGEGVSSLAASGWTGTGTGTMTKSLTFGSTLSLSGITVTNAPGYHGATWSKTSGSGTLSGTNFTIGAGAATLTVKGTANQVIVSLNKDGAAYSSSGMKISVRNSASSTSDMLSKTVSGAVSAATLSGSVLEEGITYYIFMGKDSNHKTEMVYSGVSFTGAPSASATVNYYTLTMNGTNMSKLSLNTTTVSNGNSVVVAGGSGATHSISGTASSGYSFSNWSLNGTGTIGNTATLSTNITGITSASTLTASAAEAHWSIGTNYYTTLANAVSAANAGDTIKAYSASFTDSSAVTIGKNLTIDTNGKHVTRTVTTTINSGSTVTLAGSGTLTTSSAITLITNAGGVLNVTHTGLISNTNTGNYRTITNTNSATTNKTGSGTITSNVAYDTLGGNGLFNVTSGLVSCSSGNYAIYSNGGTVTVGGGTVSGSKVAINATTGAATITNGYIVSENGSGITTTTGTITVSGGTVTGTSQGLYVTTGLLNVTGGLVSCSNGATSGQGIYAQGTSTVSRINVTGGTVTGKNGINSASTNTPSITINGTNANVISQNGSAIYGAKGTITLTKGTVTATNTGTSTVSGIQTTSGLINVNGGVIKTLTNYTYAVNSSEGGTILMTSGSINAANYGVRGAGASKISVSGGTIVKDTAIASGELVYAAGTTSSTISSSASITKTSSATFSGAAVANTGTGTMIISGGTITSGMSSNAIWNGSTGVLQVTGGVINGTGYAGTNNSTGVINVSGGLIQSPSSRGLHNASTGTINISGGTVTGKNGIANNSTGEMNISGANTKVEGTNGVAVTVGAGKVTVNGGNVIGTASGATITTGTLNITGGTITGTTYGINMSGVGSFTMGENSGTPSTTIPLIRATGTSNAYGVYISNASAVYNFYDGKVTSASGTGKSISYSGTINTPTGYVVTKSTASNTETAILSQGLATIYLKENGSNATNTGYAVSISTSSVTNSNTFSGTTTSSSITLGPLNSGTVYYIWAGKSSNAKTNMVYTGVSVTGTNGATSATINYYGLTLVKGTGINSVVNDNVVTTNQINHLNGSTVTISATVTSSGYEWDSWTKTTGTQPASFTTSTRSQNIVMGAGAVTLTANATANNYVVTFEGNGGSNQPVTNLFSKYDGYYNAGSGHSTSVTRWYDMNDNTNNLTSSTIANSTWGANYLQLDGTGYAPLGEMHNSVMSIETTFSPASSGTLSEVQYVIGNWNTGGGGIFVYTDGRIAGQYYINGAWRNAWSSSTITAGTKYHVVFTWNGSSEYIYVNGQKSTGTYTTTNGVITTPASTTYQIIGGDPKKSSGTIATPSFNGKVYSAAIYSTALSDAQVAQDYSATVTYGATYSGLPVPQRGDGYDFDGWWTTPDNTGVRVTDGNGTATGAPVSTASNHTLYAHWKADNWSINRSGTTTYYRTLAEAENAAIAGDTIFANKSFNDSSTPTISKNLTINTNGKQVVLTSGATAGISVASGVTATFTGNGTITTSTTTSRIISLFGTSTGIINGGTYKMPSGTAAVQTYDTSKLTVNGGTINSSAGQSALYHGSSSSVTITGGKIYNNGSYTGVKNGSTGKIYISGGTISGVNYGIWNVNNAGSFIVSGGSIGCSTSSCSGFYMQTGTATMSNGTINCSASSCAGIDLSNDVSTAKSLTITGGSVGCSPSSCWGIKSSGTSTKSITISGGVVSSSGSGSLAVDTQNATLNLSNNGYVLKTGGTTDPGSAVYCRASTKLNISSGTINNIAAGRAISFGGKSTMTISAGYLNSARAGAIGVSSTGKYTITGGTITGGTYGYVDTDSSGTETLTLGQGSSDTSTLSFTNPVIAGGLNASNYGLSVTRTNLNWYDGMAIGFTDKKAYNPPGSGLTLNLPGSSTHKRFELESGSIQYQIVDLKTNSHTYNDFASTVTAVQNKYTCLSANTC